MTKTQGWIIVGILVVAIFLGLGVYGQYTKSQSDATAQKITACMNTCPFIGPNHEQSNSCLAMCFQENGAPPPAAFTQ